MQDTIPQTAGSSEQSLAQVRELLFGAQTRDFDQRCNQLQEQMDRNYQGLRNELTEQLENLRAALRDEIANVRGQFANEQSDQRKKLDEVSAGLDQKIADQVNELQSRISGVNDELRAYTLNQTQHLWDDLQSRYDKLSTRLDQEVNDVRESATPRSSLGDMFREMASQLEQHSQTEEQ